MVEITQTRHIERSMYRLCQDYGKPATLYRITQGELDVATGDRGRTLAHWSVAKALRLPKKMTTSFLYDAAQTDMARGMTMGATWDSVEGRLVVRKADLPRNFKILSEDYFVVKGKKYEIVSQETWDDQAVHCFAVRETPGDPFQQNHEVNVNPIFEVSCDAN